MERFWKVLSLSLIVGIVAVVGVGMVFAQGGTPEPPYDGEGFGLGRRSHGHGDRMGFFGIDKEEVRTRLADTLGLTLEQFDAAIAEGETLASLAQAKGVSFEDLRDVMGELHDEALAKAVQDGTITQEQADQIVEGRAVKRAVSDAIDRDELHAKLAEALGLTVKEFEPAISSGEKLSTLAEGADVTLEELRDIMQGFRTDALAQAVAEGKITQEQADQMLERTELRGEGCGGMFGRPGGIGIRGGGFGKGEGFGVFSPSGGA